MSEEQQVLNQYRRTWHGYPSWTEYLKANMALMPLVTICAAAALSLADGRYMVRAEDGETIETQVEALQKSVDEIRTEQRVSKGEISHVREKLEDVKESTEEINRKLDRLIERQ